MRSMHSYAISLHFLCEFYIDLKRVLPQNGRFRQITDSFRVAKKFRGLFASQFCQLSAFVPAKVHPSLPILYQPPN